MPKGQYDVPDDRRCTAKATRTGERCRRAALKGSNVCQVHGGRLSNVKEAAARRVQRQKAAHLVEKFALPRDVPPGQALLESIHQAAGIVAYIHQKVQELDEDEIAGMLVTKESESVDSDGVRTITQEKYASVNVWVKLLGEWQDRLARISKMTIDAGIAERQVRVAEHTASLFATAIWGILRDLDVPQSEETVEIVRRQLMDLDLTPMEDTYESE